jgi:thioredoxin reductase (NADPH)
MTRADAIVIGAGPAGLIAATYLARFRRSVIVLDGGPPRALWIPESHNTPGFPDGIGGRELLARLKRQAESFGARIVTGRADVIRPGADGFEIGVDADVLESRLALMATGLVDNKPDIPGLDAAILQSLVRICPICDAMEAVDKRIAVLGDAALGAREARFLRGFSDAITLLHVGAPLAPDEIEDLARDGITVATLDVSSISFESGHVAAAIDGATTSYDCLYLALGCRMNSELAITIGAAHDEDMNLRVDDHQLTSIPDLYAAGDVVRGLNQITVAGGEAAVAATAMHKRLRENSRP